VSDPTRSVLDLLLEHHPALLSVEEVIREMTAGADEFAARDRIEVALRRLVETGLAHRLGPFVFASHAAVSARALEET
jgi:Fe2+ or Zn2+ uptake regulation protein